MKYLKFIPYAIIVILIIALCVSTCSKQEIKHDNSEQVYREFINQKEKELVVIQNREQELKEKLHTDSIKNKVSEIAFKREIKLLKFTVSELRKPVQQLIDSVPQLDAFVDAQDSLIHFQEGRIDTLTAQYYLRNIKMNGVITLTEAKFKASQEIRYNVEQLNFQLKKDVRKERRRKTAWKIATGILGALIIYESVSQ